MSEEKHVPEQLDLNDQMLVRREKLAQYEEDTIHLDNDLLFKIRHSKLRMNSVILMVNQL